MRPRHSIPTALLAAVAMAAGCQQAAVLSGAAPTQAAGSASIHSIQPTYFGPRRPLPTTFGTARLVGPLATVHVVPAALVGTDRRLLGLGFRDYAAITRVRLVAEGPGIAQAIGTTVPYTFAAPTAGAALSPPASIALDVPAGPNRLFTLEALDAAGTIVAAIRTVASPAAGASANLTFDARTDAAGRVLEDCLFTLPGQLPGNAFLASLATKDVTADLLSLAARATGYNPASNAFTEFDPRYLQDLAVARALATPGALDALHDTTQPLPHAALVPGGSRVLVHVTDAQGNPLATAKVELLDPIDAHGQTPTQVTPGEYDFTNVPPGTWQMRVTQGQTVQVVTAGVGDTGDVPVGITLTLPSTPRPTPRPTPTYSPVPLTDAAHTSVTTLAGSGLGAYADGSGTNASFNGINGLAVDQDGNIFVADAVNHRIRKVTPDGVTSTFAGSGADALKDGVGTAADFWKLGEMAIDAQDNLYVLTYSTSGNITQYAIRKVAPDATVSTVAVNRAPGDSLHNVTVVNHQVLALPGDCPAPFVPPVPNLAVTMGTPPGTLNGIAVDATGNIFLSAYVPFFKSGGFTNVPTDPYLAGHDSWLYKLDPQGNLSTLAGETHLDGLGQPTPTFANPDTLVIDAAGNLFVAERNLGGITKVTPDGDASTVVRNTGADGLTMDSFGRLYSTDASKVYLNDPTTGQATVIAGGSTTGYAEGSGTAALFTYPGPMAFAPTGELYVGSYHRVRKIQASAYTPTPTPMPTPVPLESTSPLVVSTFNYPPAPGTIPGVSPQTTFNATDLATAPDGNIWVTFMRNDPWPLNLLSLVRVFSPSGNPIATYYNTNLPASRICFDRQGNAIIMGEPNGPGNSVSPQFVQMSKTGSVLKNTTILALQTELGPNDVPFLISDPSSDQLFSEFGGTGYVEQSTQNLGTYMLHPAEFEFGNVGLRGAVCDGAGNLWLLYRRWDSIVPGQPNAFLVRRAPDGSEQVTRFVAFPDTYHLVEDDQGRFWSLGGLEVNNNLPPEDPLYGKIVVRFVGFSAQGTSFTNLVVPTDFTPTHDQSGFHLPSFSRDVPGTPTMIEDGKGHLFLLLAGRGTVPNDIIELDRQGRVLQTRQAGLAGQPRCTLGADGSIWWIGDGGLTRLSH